jgi:hypothetical protein
MAIYFVAAGTPQRAVITTVFSDLELAKQFKRGFVEHNGYAAPDITVSAVDEDGKVFD